MRVHMLGQLTLATGYPPSGSLGETVAECAVRFVDGATRRGPPAPSI